MGKVYKARAQLGPPKPPKFKIFYADGSSYTDEDGRPDAAPKAGVLMVVVEDKKLGRIIEQGGPYYVYDGLQFRNVNEAGYYMYMFSPGYKLVLFAQAVSDNSYANFLSAAISDPYLPPKTDVSESEAERYRV